MIALKQHKLMLQASLTFAQRIHPTPDRRHPLADIEMQPLDKSGIDLPSLCRSDLLHGIHGAKDHPVGDVDEAPPPV